MPYRALPVAPTPAHRLGTRTCTCVCGRRWVAAPPMRRPQASRDIGALKLIAQNVSIREKVLISKRKAESTFLGNVYDILRESLEGKLPFNQVYSLNAPTSRSVSAPLGAYTPEKLCAIQCRCGLPHSAR